MCFFCNYNDKITFTAIFLSLNYIYNIFLYNVMSFLRSVRTFI